MSLAVITGGSRGLGFEVAKALVAQGNKVVLVAKDVERLARVAQELGCDYRAVDLADLDAAKNCFMQILEDLELHRLLFLHMV